MMADPTRPGGLTGPSRPGAAACSMVGAAASRPGPSHELPGRVHASRYQPLNAGLRTSAEQHPLPADRPPV